MALQPSTGGTFIVELFYAFKETDPQDSGDFVIKNQILWDRKTEGGFPGMSHLLLHSSQFLLCSLVLKQPTLAILRNKGVEETST